MISQIYLITFLVGLVYAIIAGIMSGISGHDHGEAGGHELDHHGGDGADVGDFHHGELSSEGHEYELSHEHEMHTLEMDAHADAAVTLTPVSPVTIATFITSFGGTGLLTTELFKFPTFFSLFFATISGIIIAGAVLWGFNKVFSATQSSSEAHVATLLGIEAEVITPIPANGLGEIAYVSRGSRFTGPARSMHKRIIPKNANVIITKILGTTFYVRESIDEELRNVED